MTPTACRVRSRRRELADTVTLELEPGLAFSPGQFTMLYVPEVGEVPISLSGDPARTDRLVHTIRDVGAVSHALTGLKKGAELGVRGPFGSGWPETPPDLHALVVAGGLGLAPLRPALYRLRGRPVTLLYGARRPEELLYPRELAAWGKSWRVEVTVDHADATWRGHVGVVPHLLQRVELDPSRSLALVCGPEIMMRFTAEALLERGFRPERIFLSMERNMRCAVGTCGHCQLGPLLVCRDGPVFDYGRLAPLLRVREL